MKKSILIVTAIFILSISFGYFFGLIYENQASKMIEETFSSFKFIREWESYKIFLFIFVNNTVKAFAAMILGIFFGLIPTLFIFSNGFLIGVVVSIFSKKMGMLGIILALTPHGILEIPAILISCAYGLDLGFALYKKIRGSDVNINREILLSIHRFVKIVIPMLLTAAFIETYITPLIAVRG